MVPITRNPITHEIIAAGPAIEDASQAPNNQPDPINEPSPNNINWDRLILSSCDCLSLFINTPSLLPKIQKIICDNYTLITIIVKFIFCKSAKSLAKLVFLKFWIYNTIYIE